MDLVVCSTRAKSAIDSWLQPHSGFDIALAFYEEVTSEYADKATYSIQNKSFKFPNYCLLFDRFPNLLTYDHFLFLDDDLILSPEKILKIFDSAKRKKLDLCQPSLSSTSSGFWPHTRNKAEQKWEATDFVEIQAFCMSQRLLRRSLPFFYMVDTGSGMDLALFYILSQETYRGAILHNIQIEHPYRPENETVRILKPDFQQSTARIVERISFCFAKDPRTPTLLERTSGTYQRITYQLTQLHRWLLALQQVALQLLRKV